MNTEQKVKKVIELIKELEIRKAIYDEVDKLTLELQSEGFDQATIDGMVVTLKDNFAEKNVQWRNAAVRRFEITVKAAK